MRPFPLKPSLLAFVATVFLGSQVCRGDDPLPSWNEGPARQAILSFVARVTKEGSPEFVRPEDRIAVFDNDGTLWCEQPVYVQAVFVRDRVRALAPEHPEWKESQPFKAVLEGDRKALAGMGERGLVDLVLATHAGMTAEDFTGLVRDWVATARHPRFDRLYTRRVYQPMLEVMAYPPGEWLRDVHRLRRRRRVQARGPCGVYGLS
ncbi:MAG: haloacid dehalogenase-like hydrolase [Isosphaeraceae bacterium]